MRLNAIAALLAPSMQTMIHNSFSISGMPPAARNALITANGRANTVCWILMSEKMMASLVGKTLRSFYWDSLFVRNRPAIAH